MISRNHRRLFGSGLAILALLVMLASPRPAHAAGLIQDCRKVITVPVEGQTENYVSNDCTLDDFVAQFVTLAKYGLGLVAVLATLMLVYAGVQYLTAGGRNEKVVTGNKIITGTIVGLVVALSAYVIINFLVMALTGNTKMIKGGQPIAILFGGTQSGEKTPELERPFSGVGGTYYACRDPKNTRWDKGCEDHVLCADPANSEGEITKMQKALNAKGCGCGEVDGCFGAETLNCVRRAQRSANFTMTGTVDAPLKAWIETAARCTGNNEAIRVTAALPSASLDNLSDTYTNTTGCCVIGKKSAEAGNNVYYCENGVSQTACAAMSQLESVDRFFAGTTCMDSVAAKRVCGFCRDVSNGGIGGQISNQCFQMAGAYWCKNIATPNQDTYRGTTLVPGELQFTAGKECAGVDECNRGCVNQLLTRPPL